MSHEQPKAVTEFDKLIEAEKQTQHDLIIGDESARMLREDGQKNLARLLAYRKLHQQSGQQQATLSQ